MPERPPELSRRLLEECPWVHRLARRLVADPGRAEDAAQETMAIAWERPPEPTVPLRKWLGAVLRNAVRQVRRGEERRAHREQALPLREPADPTDEIAARLEAAERLVGQVRALPEPYRTTIALRFLEEMPARAIAKHMDVPVKTVHTRIERALARLRERLDAEHGRREDWVRLLLPLSVVRPHVVATPAGSAPSPLVPVVAMSTSMKWASGIVGLALTAVVVQGALDRSDARTSEGTVESETSSLDAPEAVLGESAPGTMEPSEPEREQRRAVSAVPRAPEEADPNPAPNDAAARPTFFGHVLDYDRRPVSGVTVRLEERGEGLDALGNGSTSPTAISEASGRFELPAPESMARLQASGEGWSTIVAPSLEAGVPPEPPLVIVAPSRSYSGLLVDPDGAPVGEAEVLVELGGELARALSPGSLAGIVPVARAQTTLHGRFRFDEVGYAPGSHLLVEVAGFRPLRHPLPEVSTTDLVLTLEPLDADEQVLAGIVLRADGSPAPNAWVAAASSAAQADATGAFVLELEKGRSAETVRAVRAGCLPAELDLRGMDRAELRSLVLTLGGEALKIRGRVLDSAGNAVPDSRVLTWDATRLGNFPRRMGSLTLMMDLRAEEVISGQRDGAPSGLDVVTDAEGRFELFGLLDRSYSLVAIHPRTLEAIEVPPVPAGGAPITLRFAETEAIGRVAGRVLTFGGEPMAGVRVRPQRLVRDPHGTPHQEGAALECVTDEQGSFELEGLCLRGLRLLLFADSIPNPDVVVLEEQVDPEAIEVRIAAPCHLRVFLPDAAYADSLTILDAEGDMLPLTVLAGGVSLSAMTIALAGTTSDLIRADESGATLVHWKDSERVTSIPLALEPGEVTEIRP